jgi:aminomethyltransferase
MSVDKRTALYETHVRAGARMVDFGLWRMPVSYEGITVEHQAVRNLVGVFDVSHMGELLVTGADARVLVDALTVNDVASLEDGQAQYSAMLTPEGTFVDDLLVYRFDAKRFMLVVNAANTAKDLEWIRGHNRTGAEVGDISDQTGLLAVQGPLALRTIGALTGADISALAPFRFVVAQVAGVEGTLSRTGYTGEDGFEFYFPGGYSVGVWARVLEAGREWGIQPAGLGARNTLRLEARMLLYGNDIDETCTPLEAGLGWMTRLEKGPFIGREALLRQKAAGPTRTLAGFAMTGREIARDGYPVSIDQTRVGRVTSGARSISLKRNIGLAWLPRDRAREGTRFQVEVRHRLAEAEVVRTPFYRRRERHES